MYSPRSQLDFFANPRQFYTAVSPLGLEEGKKVGTVEDFFYVYLAFFCVIVFWIIGFAWKRQGWLRTSQMDVDTGRRELDWDLINAERAERATWPQWRRVLSHIF
jgi:amino acid transporter